MEKLYTLCVLISLLVSCNNYDDSALYSKIQELEQQQKEQQQMIELLKSDVSIVEIVQNTDSYTIIFSSGDKITLSNGVTPIITIGNDGNWYINGVNTYQSSKGEDGKDGITPIIAIGDDGNWYINGQNSGVRAQGTDETYITSIADNGIEIVFMLSDGTSMSVAKLPANFYGVLGDIAGVGTMGASLIYDGNNWVESACHALGVDCYNKAVSGFGDPGYFANKLWRGEYCSDQEFENIDILVIQFASSGDVYQNNTGFLNDFNDYCRNFDPNICTYNQFYKYNPAQCIDYILKYWQNWCFKQKDNSKSKWYGTKHGKPCRLLFVTHWHDARVQYNNSIRKLAEKWGAAICEFDKKIGFSKDQPLADGMQVSVIYAVDTQEIDGVTYGWHPLRGTNGTYIQTRMAGIFMNSLIENFTVLAN